MGRMTSRYLPRTKTSRRTSSAMFQMKLAMPLSWAVSIQLIPGMEPANARDLSPELARTWSAASQSRILSAAVAGLFSLDAIQRMKSVSPALPDRRPESYDPICNRRCDSTGRALVTSGAGRVVWVHSGRSGGAGPDAGFRGTDPRQVDISSQSDGVLRMSHQQVIRGRLDVESRRGRTAHRHRQGPQPRRFELWKGYSFPGPRPCTCRWPSASSITLSMSALVRVTPVLVGDH